MRTFTTVYFILLVYIIAAMVFWGFSLQKQSRQIFEQERAVLHEHIDSVRQPNHYQIHLQELERKQKVRTSQYLGEGITFLFVILTGAAVVYSSFRRSIRLSRQQKNFMLSVTHELKSPLAAMKLNLQTLERHQLDADKQQMLVNRCIMEANRLNDLCNNMLIASQMEGQQYVATREQLDFAELVLYACREYQQRYPGRFSWETPAEQIFVSGDRLLLHMAINNLLENAVKYGGQGSPVRLSLEHTDKAVTFSVADNGSGIPDEEKKKIFQKFYRIGNESTRKAKGTGLGLYLTARIMKQHHGQASVEDNESSGSIFKLQLPLA